MKAVIGVSKDGNLKGNIRGKKHTMKPPRDNKSHTHTHTHTHIPCRIFEKPRTQKVPHAKSVDLFQNQLSAA